MSGEPCYSIVRKPKGYELSNEMTLKKRIECDNLEKCQKALAELLQSLLDGEKFPTNLMMSVINRYQMNRFAGDVGNRDKRIKKLLYVLWECLPKRGPDGKFLDKMVMVCGAFDKDLKHPNQYVCGSVLRTLSKTREPEVIRELVHSIEKCLEWSHAYQRKNAVLAIARIYKNFPDLNPSAPKLISEYLMKENDDECKRAALQALLEIDPEEAKPYLHSSNVQDIHCMNASIQLLFVELIQRVFKKDSEEAQDYLAILSGLIKLSSSPSVRYQAASTLMKFSRDPEAIKLVAACFIDICAKDSDNNVKLIALDSLTRLRQIKGAERVIRNSVMDILFILQSSSDVTLQGKILRLTLELLSSLNVGGVVAALRQEIEKNANDQEKSGYRRFLIAAAHNIAERFPNAVVEFEMMDTLFGLLLNNPGENTSLDLILLFQMFMTKNPPMQGSIVKKIQDNFNLIRNSQSIHCGLIRLLGEFSETKEQIEKSYLVIKESMGELPIVASEMRKRAQANEESPSADDTSNNASVTSNKSSAANGDVDIITKGVKQLVTADGSYATQSAISYQTSSNVDEEHPPLRAYYLNNKFESASVLSRALLKMACRYRQSGATNSECGKMIARFMLLISSIIHLGHSSLTDADGNTIHINDEHSQNLMVALTILQKIWTDSPKDVARRLKEIITDEFRSQLGVAVKKADDDDRFAGDSFSKKKTEPAKFNDAICISLFESRDKDIVFDDRDLDDTDSSQLSMPDMFGEIPLTGTIDAIYAYCEFDVNQYDIGLKIHLENRTRATLENVTLELAARGESSSNFIDRPDPIVLAPRATACITSNIKVVSAENRRLFGSIAYDDTSRISADDREQVLMLNDISVNITDYIKPATTSFDEFRAVWRDCEWENKVTVKTKLTNLKEYLAQLVAATNMRCVTTEKSLDGDNTSLSANLYAKSSFGEEALVNVSIDQETPSSIVRGSVKIRSRSQGMALSLGEKITAAQNAAAQP
uniref:Coatomer subunit beta n=1 Tax=Aceria tosichella TaxID=561515 RepID=A0A6G1SHU2_9ACAR